MPDSFGPVKYIIAKISAPASRGWGWALRNDCLLCGAPRCRGLFCDACATALPWQREACERCAAPLFRTDTCGACRRSPPAFDAASAVFDYGFPLDRLVHRFKFRGDFALGRWLAQALARRVAAAPRPDVLVAPPL